jgi:hypothetical protein
MDDLKYTFLDFDFETVGFEKGEVLDIWMGSRRLTRNKGASLTRPNTPNIIEIFGQTEEDSIHIKTPFYDGNEQAKKLAEEIRYEFQYKDTTADLESGEVKWKTLSHEQIKKHISGEEVHPQLASREGRFQTSDTAKTRDALHGLWSFGPSEPNRAQWDTGITIRGSTLNRNLAENLFDIESQSEAIGKGPDRAAALHSFVDYISGAKEKAASEGKTLAMRAWNAPFDMRVFAQTIDETGDEDLLRKFTRLFDESGSIRLVEASDKFRDIMFELTKRSDKNHFMNLDHGAIQRSLGNSTELREIADRVYGTLSGQVTDGLPSQYIKESTLLGNLAERVKEGEGRSSQTVADIKAEVIGRITGQNQEQGFRDFGGHLGNVQSNEGKIVDAVAELLHNLINPLEELGPTETLRRSMLEIRALDQADLANEIMQRAVMPSSPGRIVPGLLLDFGSPPPAPEGTALHLVHKHLGNALGGTLPDFMGGATLSSGNTGLLGSIMTAKDNYLETINAGRPSEHLQEIFGLIDDNLAVQLNTLETTGGHSASIDVDNMARILRNVLDQGYKNIADPDVQSFMSDVFHENVIKSSEDRLAQKYGTWGELDPIVQGKLASLVGRTPEEVMDPSAKNHSGKSGIVGSVDPGFRGKASIFAKSAFVLSGIVLIANRTGDIKDQGSKYNTLEGMSPSGDPLLHSFGSGNSHMNNMAINNLIYNFDIGSDTLRSSMLGYKGDQLANQLIGRELFDDYTNSSERGSIVHGIIEQEYLQKKLAQNTEHYIYSSELDVAGHVDIILNSGVPLEIKTVADFDALKELSYPKDKHVSQANFYAYALNQPYALIGYAARNDPSKIKYFKIDVNIKRLMDEVAIVRNVATNLKTQGYQISTYPVYQQSQDMIRNMTQNKYSRNPGVYTSMQNGLVHSTERENQYSAIKGLGDYKKRNKNTNVFRGTDPRVAQKKFRNRSSEGRGPSGNKTNHLFAGIIRSSPRESGYHPGSRAERTATATT